MLYFTIFFHITSLNLMCILHVRHISNSDQPFWVFDCHLWPVALFRIGQCWALLSVCQAGVHRTASVKAGRAARRKTSALRLCLLVLSQFLLICLKHKALQIPDASLPANSRPSPAPGTSGTSWVDGMGKNYSQTHCFLTLVPGHVLGPSPWPGWISLQLLLSPRDKRFSAFRPLPRTPVGHCPEACI